MKKITPWSIALAIILFFSFSCKKNSPAQTCQLSTIGSSFGSSNTTYNFTYNNAGKISTIVATGSNAYTKVFTYSANLIMITTSISGSVAFTDSVVLNPINLISYLSETDANNTVTVRIFTYDVNGQIQQATNQVNGGTVSTTTYSYTNGDATSSSDGTSTTAYTYLTSKPNEDGDVLKVVQLLSFGALYIKNVHLISGIQSATAIENFSYSFDSSGKITVATATVSSFIQTLTYQYNCH